MSHCDSFFPLAFAEMCETESIDLIHGTAVKPKDNLGLM